MSGRRELFPLFSREVVEGNLRAKEATTEFYELHVHHVRLHLHRAVEAAEELVLRLANETSLPDVFDVEGEPELALQSLLRVVEARDAFEDAFRFVIQTAGNPSLGKAGRRPERAPERAVVRLLQEEAEMLGYDLPTEAVQERIDAITNAARNPGMLARQLRRDNAKRKPGP